MALLFAVPSSFPQEAPKTHPVRPAELRATIVHASKIVVYDSTPAISTDGADVPARVLYSSDSAKDILELSDAIVIERPESWFRCACIPPIEIVLSRDGEKLGVISVYQELTIGFSRWSSDARIKDEERLLRWFDARGITGPRRSVEEIRAREKAEQAASDRWLSAMPSTLRPLWPKLMRDSQWWSDPQAAVATSVRKLKPDLEREFPDPQKRVLALFAWFGSGAGPWSGYPAYEDIAAQLLLVYQPAELLSGFQVATLTDSEMEGAARFFSEYCYGYAFCPPEERKLSRLLPDEIKKNLLEHVLKGNDQDNVDRARRSLGQN